MAFARASRRAYRQFLEEYRDRRLSGQAAPMPGIRTHLSAPPAAGAPPRGYLRDYLRWLRPHGQRFAGVLLLALVVTGLEMIVPMFIRFVVDRVLLDDGSDAPTRLARLHLSGLAFAGIVVFSNGLRLVKDYRQNVLNARLTLSLRRALFDRFLALPLPRLSDLKAGGILSRLSGDVDTTAGLLQSAAIGPAVSVVKLAIAIAMLTLLNWRLALMALAIVPMVILASFAFSKRIRPIYRSVRDDVARIDGRAGETFSGIRVVRAFAREACERFDYMCGRHGIVRKELFAQRREAAVAMVWGLLGGAVNVMIVWYGGRLNLRGEATVGDIMACQWYAFLLLTPVWTLVSSYAEMQRSCAAVERVFEVLATSGDKPDRAGAREAPPIVEEIRFESVDFEYREGRPVVRDFNLVVPGGSVVALVGRSGAGKTTVTDLVARFADPTRGRILLNGDDARNYRLASYRQRLAIVQQDVFLFDGSIRDAIAYGRKDATASEIELAARRANAHEFIVRLPAGYDTPVGERGIALSGGEQQRLAIARALLAAPQVLILDEATSNLDSESEQLIQVALGALLAERTTFVIAHRLSTVRRADQILLMDAGRVVERGTHESLMAAGGRYRAMVMRQIGYAEPPDADVLRAS